MTIIADGALEPAKQILRPEASREAAAQLLRVTPPVVVVTGKSGSGRTAFLHEVAAELALAGNTLELRNAPLFASDPAEALSTEIDRITAESATSETVLVIDNFDHVAGFATQHVNSELLYLVDWSARYYKIRFLLVIEDRYFNRLTELHTALAGSVIRVPLPDLSPDHLSKLVTTEAKKLVDHVGASCSPEIVKHALTPATSRDQQAHPKLAISRIDAAIRRADLMQAPQIETVHLNLEHSYAAPMSATELKRQLSSSVRGQSKAISVLADRLAPALAGLSLRPERPHGVFLLVGPSGVGKTETAKQLARLVYGSEDALIRLNMSEYADERDGRMKLIGGSKIWKNSSTDGLLTTRVREKPRSVVLLDEFEKSDPGLWPLFLQAFDEGVLADGWGNNASFADTVIILTSNLGAREGSARSAGFGADEGFQTDRQLEAVTNTLPPELFGRISETICFAPLSAKALKELARDELDRTATRIAASGWRFEYTSAVVDWLAETNYDPSRGARHLQNTIERELFPRLVAAGSKWVRASVRSAELIVEPMESHYPEREVFIHSDRPCLVD